MKFSMRWMSSTLIGVNVGDGVTVGLTVGDGEAEGVWLGVAVGELVSVGVGLGVGLGVGDCVGEGDNVGEGVGDSVGDGDKVGEAVGEGESVGEAVGEGDAVGVTVGGAVCVGLAVGENVGTGVCEGVGDGENVGEGEAVKVGLAVGEGVGVGVCPANASPESSTCADSISEVTVSVALLVPSLVGSKATSITRVCPEGRGAAENGVTVNSPGSAPEITSTGSVNVRSDWPMFFTVTCSGADGPPVTETFPKFRSPGVTSISAGPVLGAKVRVY